MHAVKPGAPGAQRGGPGERERQQNKQRGGQEDLSRGENCRGPPGVVRVKGDKVDRSTRCLFLKTEILRCSKFEQGMGVNDETDKVMRGGER